MEKVKTMKALKIKIAIAGLIAFAIGIGATKLGLVDNHYITLSIAFLGFAIMIISILALIGKLYTVTSESHDAYHDSHTHEISMGRPGRFLSAGKYFS